MIKIAINSISRLMNIYFMLVSSLSLFGQNIYIIHKCTFIYVCIGLSEYSVFAAFV